MGGRGKPCIKVDRVLAPGITQAIAASLTVALRLSDKYRSAHDSAFAALAEPFRLDSKIPLIQAAIETGHQWTEES